MSRKAVQVKDLVDKFALKVINGAQGLSNQITVTDLKRPGIELAGFWKYFVPERVQVLGKTEISFLHELPEEILKERIEKFMSFEPRVIIVTRNLEIPPIMAKLSDQHHVPVCSTHFSTSTFISLIINYLERELAPEKTIHGVLVDVYGVGLLILGESGIGKSETAIELVKRGHRLVADDVIEIKKIGENELYGNAPEASRYFLELRGIGIINVRQLFGAGAVKDRSPINMVTRLERWQDSENYDRLGLDNQTTSLLGIEKPVVTIPVKPGRNLAMVLEVAAMNSRMKNMGYNAARDFADRVYK